MTNDFLGAAPEPSPQIDTTVPHSARIWNYWLGGTDNYPVDREAGDQYREVYPQIVDIARASRAFQVRAVRYLTGEAGLRQFLDVGAGLPAVQNTHEVAQRIAPDSRVVYVDHDPEVVAHGRTLLRGAQDLPRAVQVSLDELGGARRRAAAATLDFSQPVALMLMGVMGHIDYADAYPIVAHLVDGLPAGSYLALQDGVLAGETFHEAQEGYDDTGAIPYRLRRPDQVAAFFDGMELVDPGVVPLPRWRPDPGQPGPDVDSVGGVAKKTT